MAEIKKINTEFQLLDKFLDTSGDAGASGQVLSSTASGVNWVSGGSLPGGPYLPLAGGTMTGALSGTSATFAGTLTSGTHTINSGNDAILTLNQTGTDTGWSYINFNTSGTRNYYVGQDSQKNWEVYNDNLNVVAISVKYATNFVNIGGDLTVEGGDITLSGTGRIQGIDTVSASTDAANKAYVDAHGGGLGPFLPLAGGAMTGTAGVLMPDNFKLNLGTGNDFQLYHDGTHGVLNNTTGNLYTSAQGSMMFRTSLNVTALTLDASQNAVFYGVLTYH